MKSSHEGIKYGLSWTLMCAVLVSSAHGNITAYRDYDGKTLSCLEWALNENLRHIILEAQHKVSPCPCTSQQAELEHTFEKTDNCFTEYIYTDGVKQRCCYDTTGKLLINKSGAGYLVVEAFSKNMTGVYQNCCHGDIGTCQRFYDINPSNKCSGYTSPRYLSSGGDLHITTIDGVEYDFNGHGEYVFLKLDNEYDSLEIQIRTDYLVAGKIDSTIITAVAIKVSSTMLTVLLNKTSHTAALYNNSVFHSLSSQNIYPIRGHPISIYPTRDNAFFLQYKTRNSGVLISIKAGDYLDLQLSKPKGKILHESIGLAGSSNNGTLLSGNGTKYSVNISEHDFFFFGETWSLHTESDSVFDYKLTNGTFSVYNGYHTKPKFLEDLVDNLTALFENKTGDEIAIYTKTCERNKECLLAIARSGDIQQGELIMVDIHREQLREEFATNTPPYFFSNWTRTLNISYSKTYLVLDLKTVAGDNQDSADQLKFSVITTLNKTDFALRDGVFNWTYILPSLRYEDIVITFIVIDHLNTTNTAHVSILYCGCEKDSQCNYGDIATNGERFTRVSCDCSGDIFAEGEFCEIDKPPCNVFKCSPLVRCHNDSLNKSNPCEPCPAGYNGDGMSCLDRNECDPPFKGQYCDQICTNYEGSYTCDCWNGYELAENNSTCNDVNECDTRPDPCLHTDKNMRCRNLPGSFECICMPGFYKVEAKCVAGGYSYVGSLTLSIANWKTEVTEVEKRTITETLAILFQNVANFVLVEILEIHFGVALTRNKNETKTGDQNSVQVVYKIMTSVPVDHATLEKNIQTSASLTLKTSNPNLFNASLSGAYLNLYDESENLLCRYTTTLCDPVSTWCQAVKGTTECACQSGFYKSRSYATFCNDVNECQNQSFVASRCIGGSCRNVPGSWKCSCPDDQISKSLGNGSFLCESDHQYVGNISITWRKKYNQSEVQNYVLELLNASFNESNITTSVGPLAWQIFLGAEVDNSSLQLKNESGLEPGWNKLEISLRYILHFGASLSWTEVLALQTMALKSSEFNNNSLITIENTFVYNGSNVITETEVSICIIPGKTHCDKATTNCVTENGIPACMCKSGFDKDGLSISSESCKDIDECSHGAVCAGGEKCINFQGGWSCNCDKFSSFTKINGTFGSCTAYTTEEAKAAGSFIAGLGVGLGVALLSVIGLSVAFMLLWRRRHKKVPRRESSHSSMVSAPGQGMQGARPAKHSQTLALDTIINEVSPTDRVDIDPGVHTYETPATDYQRLYQNLGKADNEYSSLDGEGLSPANGNYFTALNMYSDTSTDKNAYSRLEKS